MATLIFVYKTYALPSLNAAGNALASTQQFTPRRQPLSTSLDMGEATFPSLQAMGSGELKCMGFCAHPTHWSLLQDTTEKLEQV